MEPVVGIIAEYNPFHNGHVYHIQEAKCRSGALCAVAVMSGNFVQRGEAALADKWARAEAAVRGGADLVLELPFPYACNNAEWFARGGIGVLRGLGCVTHLAFGCESETPETLETAAQVFATEPQAFRQALRAFLDQGDSYPKARANALRMLIGEVADVIETPNNILAVEYLKQCRLQNWSPMPVPVVRKGASYADPMLPAHGSVASASAIRAQFGADDRCSASRVLQAFLPEASLNMMRKCGVSQNALEAGMHPLLLSKILSGRPEELERIFSAGEGLQNKLKRAAMQAETTEELIRLVKSKRYTETRIRRLLIHTLFGLTKDDPAVQPGAPLYARILAMNEQGTALLRRIKKEETATIPVLTAPHRELEKESALRELMRWDYMASDFYHLIRGESLQKQTDYVKNPVYVKKFNICDKK